MLHIIKDDFDESPEDILNTINNMLNKNEELENEKEYKVELAAPGMTKEDFDVHIDEENNLVISMEKKNEKKEDEKNGRYLRREFSYSKFQQTMILPEDVDKEKISATVNNGVLDIELPKLVKEELPKQKRVIEIQ